MDQPCMDNPVRNVIPEEAISEAKPGPEETIYHLRKLNSQLHERIQDLERINSRQLSEIYTLRSINANLIMSIESTLNLAKHTNGGNINE